VQLPRDEILCSTFLASYKSFLEKRNRRLKEAIAERVADEETQSTVFEFLIERVRRGALAH